MKFKFLFFLQLFVTSFCFGQLDVTSPDFGPNNPLDCNNFSIVSNNFKDNADGSNYGNDRRDTVTFCPDIINGTKLLFTTENNPAFIWAIDASDTLYVFDGQTTSSALLGAVNSATHPTGFSTSSSFSNASGCLTFVFHSDASTDDIGWEGAILCNNPVQPIDVNLQAYINGSTTDVLLTDSLNIKLCIGDTLKLIIDPEYPNSLESTGVGYSQNDGNVAVKWNWSNGQAFTAVDTVTYIVTSETGFVSSVLLTDSKPSETKQSVNIMIGVKPNFGNLMAVPDIVCLGDQTTLFGGFNSADSTMYGSSTPPGEITIGGSVSGEFYLPDGTGQALQPQIEISGFDPSQTLTSSCSLKDICINLEHSFVGDLDVVLICPNGTTASLFEGSGGNYLGEPVDEETTPTLKGIGYTYCFSDDATTLLIDGPTQQLTSPPSPSAGITIEAGTYKPTSVLATALAGCPLNGIWKMSILDNLADDNGWIFEWGITFDACNPGTVQTYQTKPISAGYLNVNPIISQTDSTKVTVVQNEGANPYVFQVEDNFGCFHDTTISVIAHFVDLVQPSPVCSGDVLTMTTNYSSESGTWSYASTVGVATFASQTAVNTVVSFTNPGTYNLIYTGNTCANDDTIVVEYEGYVPFNMNAPFHICPNDPKLFTIQNSTAFQSVDWNLGLPTDTDFSNMLSPGSVTINGIGTNGCPYDTSFTVTSQAAIELIYPLTLPDNGLCFWSLNDTLKMTENTGVQPGQWTSIDPTGGTSTFVSGTESVLNPNITFSAYGTYTFIYTEPTCQDDDTIIFRLVPPAYYDKKDYSICEGYSESLQPQPLQLLLDGNYITDMVWSTGATTLYIDAAVEGYYTFSITTGCNTFVDSIFLDVKDCSITMPNIITPNGDGINDQYKIIFNGETDIFTEFHITIVNRWGNVIAEYNDPFGVWDGKNKAGDLVEAGAYFYSVEALTIQGEELTKQGFIQVQH